MSTTAGNGVLELELKRSWRTLREMFVDRIGPGATLAPEMDVVSPEDFAASMAGKHVFAFDVPSASCRIVYDLSPRFKTGSIKRLVDGGDFAIVMVVLRESPTSTARKSLESSGRDLQFFTVAELQFNVSHHTLVPKHEPIRDEAEIEVIVAGHHARSRFHFPLILSSDPMARYLSLKHGQLVRITRASPSAGTYTLYRCCQKATA